MFDFDTTKYSLTGDPRDKKSEILKLKNKAKCITLCIGDAGREQMLILSKYLVDMLAFAVLHKQKTLAHCQHQFGF